MEGWIVGRTRAEILILPAFHNAATLNIIAQWPHEVSVGNGQSGNSQLGGNYDISEA